MTNLSTEEKIDYIYETLKSQKRRQLFGDIFKWGRRIFVIGSLVYFYYFGAQIIETQVKNILKSSTPDVSIDSMMGSGMLDKIKGLLKDTTKTNEF